MILRRRKTVALFLLLSVSVLSINSVAQAGRFGFLKKILNQGDTAVKKLAKEVAPSSRKVLDPSDLRKVLPDIPVKKITPEIASIATMGKKFTDQGPFARKFINSVPDPGEALRQFSKYGNGYVKTAECVSSTFTRHIDDIMAISKSSTKAGKFPFSPNYLPKFKNPNFVNKKFVDILKRTGKKGYEVTTKIGKWAAKHPKSTAAGVAFTWYMVDPEGFTEALRKSGKTVGEFVTASAGGVAEGVGQGFLTKIKEILTIQKGPYIVFGTLLLLVVFVRPVRRFVFIPFKAIGNKMNKTADKYDNASDFTRNPDIANKTDQTSSTTNGKNGSSIFD
jgi:hypothetical protein